MRAIWIILPAHGVIHIMNQLSINGVKMFLLTVPGLFRKHTKFEIITFFTINENPAIFFKRRAWCKATRPQGSLWSCAGNRDPPAEQKDRGLLERDWVQSRNSRMLITFFLVSYTIFRRVALGSILVPRAYDPSGLQQESRALGATISGMRHR